MNLYKVHLTILLMVMSCSRTMAQDASRLTHDVEASIEASATVSSGEFAPLWLSSNRQGIVSPYGKSSYERVGVFRSTTADSARQWRIGYGLDLTLNQNAQSTFFIHQAYAQIDYKKLSITIGSKERKIDLRNNELTSGGLSQGINAQPIPMVRVDIDYFRLTDWWKMKLRGGYGMTTDGAWQKRWIGDPETMRYTGNVLYHEKAMYWKFGKEEKLPLTLELGVQMQTLFGGTTYNVDHRGFVASSQGYDLGNGLNSFWNALLPFGSTDATDGSVNNTKGDVLGSYNAALTWKSKNGLQLRAYWEHFFEDHSQMFYQYYFYDHLAGVDAYFPKNPYVSDILIEHLFTKDQSGPVYHDPTHNMPDKYAGQDNYYNHILYSGWQHWGMGIGNPLIMSPIYNSDHRMVFKSNRTKGWHIGVCGTPSDELKWKVKMSWTQDWGTYGEPLDDVVNQQHYMAEIQYAPRRLDGWSGSFCFAVSNGLMIGNTVGAQLTVKKEIKQLWKRR